MVPSFRVGGVREQQHHALLASKRFRDFGTIVEILEKGVQASCSKSCEGTKLVDEIVLVNHKTSARDLNKKEFQ